MKHSKPDLLAVAFISLLMLAVALYLQHVENMQPCPLCVIQRYAFAAIALFCLIGAFMQGGRARISAALAACAAIAGAGVAAWHIYIKANPTISCGIDPLETSLNTLPTAQLLPFLFKADGLCTTDYAPILGLSIPQWALIWFVVLGIFLLRITFKKTP